MKNSQLCVLCSQLFLAGAMVSQDITSMLCSVMLMGAWLVLAFAFGKGKQ